MFHLDKQKIENENTKFALLMFSICGILIREFFVMRSIFTQLTIKIFASSYPRNYNSDFLDWL